MTRRSSRPVTLAPVNLPPLPDDAVTAPVEVDDPCSRPAQEDRIIVMRALRDDPLAMMHARGQIDDAQYRAGREFQRFHEVTAVGEVRSIDLSRQRVDASVRRHGVTDRQMIAIYQLKRLAAVLGDRIFSLVEAFLVRRHTLTQIAAACGLNASPDSRDVRRLGKEIRGALDVIAVDQGYANAARQRKDGLKKAC